MFSCILGVFNYLRTNYGNPPNPDLSPSFLSALTELMLAQAQECELERKILGGFEIQLGKCVLIAQEAMKVISFFALCENSQIALCIFKSALSYIMSDSALFRQTHSASFRKTF